MKVRIGIVTFKGESMEGVEILNIIPERQELTILAIIGIITISVCALVVIISIAIDLHDEFSGTLAGISLAIALIPIICGGIWATDRETIPIRYEVVISDDVNYNDFIKQYEVIEQRGKILVVQERSS